MPVSRKINDVELGCREREKSRDRTHKFNLDQNNKYEYMIHYRMFFCVKIGVKATKVRRVFKIKEGYFLETIFKTIQIKEQRLKLKQKSM